MPYSITFLSGWPDSREGIAGRRSSPGGTYMPQDLSQAEQASIAAVLTTLRTEAAAVADSPTGLVLNALADELSEYGDAAGVVPASVLP